MVWFFRFGCKSLLSNLCMHKVVSIDPVSSLKELGCYILRHWNLGDIDGDGEYQRRQWLRSSHSSSYNIPFLCGLYEKLSFVVLYFFLRKEIASFLHQRWTKCSLFVVLRYLVDTLFMTFLTWVCKCEAWQEISEVSKGLFFYCTFVIDILE